MYAPKRATKGISARFVNLRIVSCWSTNWTQGGPAKRGVGDEGAWVELRSEVIPQVCGRAVPKCRRQGFVDGRFERNDFGVAKSLPYFLGIESLQACDALLQPLDPALLLAGGQDRRSGLGRRNRTTGHGIPAEYVIKDTRIMGDIMAANPTWINREGVEHPSQSLTS
jgi:hypothetical protein